MVGVRAHAQVEAVLAAELCERLVRGDTGGLERLGGQLLALVRHEVHDERELVDARPLVADVVDAQLGVGDAAAVARLDVRLVLAVAVAAGGAAAHSDGGSVGSNVRKNGRLCGMVAACGVTFSIVPRVAPGAPAIGSQNVNVQPVVKFMATYFRGCAAVIR